MMKKFYCTPIGRVIPIIFIILLPPNGGIKLIKLLSNNYLLNY